MPALPFTQQNASAEMSFLFTFLLGFLSRTYVSLCILCSIFLGLLFAIHAQIIMSLISARPAQSNGEKNGTQSTQK
jgi:hypothetical protein